jgi:hypothetical protein
MGGKVKLKKAIDIIKEIIKEQLPMISDGAINQLAKSISKRFSLDNIVEFNDGDLKKI